MLVSRKQMMFLSPPCRWIESSVLNASGFSIGFHIWRNTCDLSHCGKLNCGSWVPKTLALEEKPLLDHVNLTSQPRWCCHKGNEMNCKESLFLSLCCIFIKVQLLAFVSK